MIVTKLFFSKNGLMTQLNSPYAKNIRMQRAEAYH